MRLITCVAIAFMLCAVSAQAAEVPTSAGDKAMVFMFHGLCDLHLDGYDEYGIGMRYYLADGLALRGGVMFGMSSEKDESGDEDEEKTESMMGLEAVLEMHMEGPCASVSPYFGVGGAFEMDSTEYENWPGHTDGKDSCTKFSGFGVAGFEWGFTNCMTLGGEYRLGFSTQSGEFEPDEGDTQEGPTETDFGFQTASVYLSVYW
jgi:opacity protein-like surface antigen